MFGRLLGRWGARAREREALAPLYRAIVSTARRPLWYREGGVPDTLDGRFDMMAAMVALVLLRLEEAGDAGRVPSARLTELFVADMDGQLRQAGIGDIVVGKHVGRMMGALGGRLGAFREGFQDGALLDEAVRRNLLRGAPASDAQVALLRDGLVALMAALRATPVTELMDGAWQA